MFCVGKTGHVRSPLLLILPGQLVFEVFHIESSSTESEGEEEELWDSTDPNYVTKYVSVASAPISLLLLPLLSLSHCYHYYLSYCCHYYLSYCCHYYLSHCCHYYHSYCCHYYH